MSCTDPAPITIRATTVLTLCHSPLFRIIPFTNMKRAYEDCDGERRPTKVRRVLNVDRLSELSDELLVRILSFVPVESLLVCQRYRVDFLLPDSTLTVSDCRRSSVGSHSTLNYGKPHTIEYLFFHERHASPVSRTQAPPTIYTTHRASPSGWMTAIL